MMIKRRINEDFKYVWAINWNGLPEDFSDATEIVLTASVFGKKKQLERGIDYVIEGNLIIVDFTPRFATISGIYNLELKYIKPSDGFIDGERRSAVDIDVVQIVSKSSQATATGDITSTSEAAFGFQGLSAYEVWLKDNPDKTKEDYYNWLQKPATDAAASLSTLEQTVSDNEALRVTAEQGRSDAELLRVGAEGIRNSNETDRIEAEGIRDANETARINAESDRVDAEDLRDQAEVAREEAEGLRQTNTATAIQNAGLATTAANTAAGLANNAATAANTAAGDANDAADAANTAAGLANNAATTANTAAGLADNARLAIQDDLALKANHGYDSSPKTLKEVDDAKLDKSSVKQVLGASTTDVMSQKAVTDEFMLKADQIELDQLADEVSDLNKPIATYTYDLNPEITITSIDVVTGTFTSPSHGLANGDMVSFAKNKTTLDARNPLYFLPNGVLIVTYYVINATTDTFQISTEIGGSALAMTSNDTMDLTKVHLEILSAKTVTISGLPVSGNYKANLRLNCTDWVSAGVQFRPKTYPHTLRWLISLVSLTSSDISYFDVLISGASFAAISAEFSLIGGHKNATFKGISTKYMGPSLAKSDNISLTLSDVVPNSTADITDITVESTASTFYVLNGTTIEVYKL